VIPAPAFLVLAVVLFALGVAAFFVKRDLLTQFMAVEVMLNAGSLAFLAVAKNAAKAEAQVMVVFVLTAAAAEAVVGLAIILHFFRRRKSVRTEDIDGLKG
jgi:NADH-quinone oxidoreductase subunit K